MLKKEIEQKEIKEELEEIANQLDKADYNIYSGINTIDEISKNLSEIDRIVSMCKDRILALSEDVNNILLKDEPVKDEPVLELHNWADFLALQDGMLTQIYLLKSVADNLKIGQVIEISSGILGESETTLKRKVTQIYNAPFLKTEKAYKSIVHFENTGE